HSHSSVDGREDHPFRSLPYRHRGSGCRNFIKSRSAIRVRPLSAPETRLCIFLSRLCLSKIAELERPRRYPKAFGTPSNLLSGIASSIPCPRCDARQAILVCYITWTDAHMLYSPSSKNWFDKALRTSTIIKYDEVLKAVAPNVHHRFAGAH